MLTIKGTRGERLVLGIPNNNVRKQYYGYLLEDYQNRSYVNTMQLDDGFYEMAYEGEWRKCLQFMADSYAKLSSVRDAIESERNLQGFFMAYFSMTNYYYTAPELELNHGFATFSFCPTSRIMPRNIATFSNSRSCTRALPKSMRRSSGTMP